MFTKVGSSRFVIRAVFLMYAAFLHAEDATPQPSPARMAPPPAAVSISAAPSPDIGPIIDQLNADDLKEAVKLLRDNFVTPAAVNDEAIAKATLGGLLTRLGNGALLIPPRPAESPASPPAPPAATAVPEDFHMEALPTGVGYARLGSLTKDHLSDLDKALKSFTDAQLPAVVLDLRATSATGGGDTYELAAEVIRQFVPKGRPLFTLKKPVSGAAQDRLFTSTADTVFTGRLLVVTDADTAGAAEVIAAVLRDQVGALIIGEKTAGQAVDYAGFGLSNGAILRVAVAQIVLPPSETSLFPNGVKPDLIAATPRARKIEIFRQTAAGEDMPGSSMEPYVFDTDHPHFNEAALVAGTNPELDAARDAQALRREGLSPAKPVPSDVALQRAIDLATAIDVTDIKPATK